MTILPMYRRFVLGGVVLLLVILGGWLVSEHRGFTERLFGATVDTLPVFALAPQTVTFADGTEATLRLAEGFNVAVAAEGLGKARFMTKSPDGRFFVPDMADYNLSHDGRLMVLDDFNPPIPRGSAAGFPLRKV